jgi:hypothetical protein
VLWLPGSGFRDALRLPAAGGWSPLVPVANPTQNEAFPPQSPSLLQWMTERGGGSDVSGATETVAVAEPGSDGGVGSWFR